MQPGPEISDNSTPPEIPAPMLSYASPPGFTPGGQWQDGKILVTHKQATFLDCCVKCGQPSDGKIWTHKYYWHHPAYALLVLVQIFVYIIVALIVRKSMTVNLYLCEHHRARRNRSMLIAWLLALAGLGGLIGGAVYAANARSSDAWIGGMIALGGFVALIAAIVVGFAFAPILKPKKIDKEYAWFKGASPEYLAQLPTVVTR